MPDVLLLGNDPADRQWSMLGCGRQLFAALEKTAPPGWRIAYRAPNTTKALRWIRKLPKGQALGMYCSRYGIYPGMAAGRPANFFHILDHGNASLIRHLDPARTVITCNDLIPFLREGNTRRGRLTQRAYTHILNGLREAARIIAISENTKQDLVRKLSIPEERIDVVYFGIDPVFESLEPGNSRSQLRKQLGLPNNPLILHIGATVQYKNVEGVLRCLALLCGRNFPVHLVRGGAPLTPSQRQLAARLGVRAQIIEIGFCSNTRLKQLYQAADLLLFPSWYEGFGLPPVEAMACGLPVVASSKGALQESVADAGLTVEPDDPDAMANTVERVLEDARLRTDLIRKGEQHALRFQWKAAAERTWSIYQKLHGILH